MLSGRSAEGVRSVETGHRRNAGFAMHLPAYGPNRLRPELPGKGARLVVAPRVLVDATAVPADRGALGRYVDGLVIALEAAGADLGVACQRAVEEREGRVVTCARGFSLGRPRSRTGPRGWPGSRAACRWSPSS